MNYASLSFVLGVPLDANRGFMVASKFVVR